MNVVMIYDMIGSLPAGPARAGGLMSNVAYPSTGTVQYQLQE